MNPMELSQAYPQNYVGHGDFGNIDVLENLQKALSAGSAIAPGAFTGGRARELRNDQSRLPSISGINGRR